MVHWAKPRPALGGLFGRAAELAALALRIEGADRLVTLTGGPGFGKTRLGEALFEATADRSAWTGGRWFARLSALSPDPVEAVCSTLGLASVPGVPPVERVGAHLASLGRVLLVIDGLEPGLSEARRSLATWLAAAPGLSIVATSREALGLAGEACAVVGPLDDDAALALFTRLSEAASPGASAVSGWGEAVRRLVRRLDGNPLALECAAARMTVLSPQALLARLDDRLGALGAPTGPGSERRGLRDALDEAWHALSPAEQRGLARLSVFDGPASLEAIEHVLVAGDPPGTDPPPLECLERLTRKSLVALRAASPPALGRRFFLYETVRGYAADWLRREPGEAREAEAGLAS